MITKGLDIFGFDDLEVRVYDPQTKTIIKKFETINKAANQLGLTVPMVRLACSTRKRKYSPSLDKEVALRLVNKNRP